VLDSLVASRWNDARRPTESQQRGFLDAWTALRLQVDALDEASSDVAYWKQLIKSVEAHARYTFAVDSSSWAAFNGRDKQMASNLVWLAQERFKGRKIIVWAASVHNARSLNSVDSQSSEFNYKVRSPWGITSGKRSGRIRTPSGLLPSRDPLEPGGMRPNHCLPLVLNPLEVYGLKQAQN